MKKKHNEMAKARKHKKVFKEKKKSRFVVWGERTKLKRRKKKAVYRIKYTRDG
jgi:hypothetical protein